MLSGFLYDTFNWESKPTSMIIQLVDLLVRVSQGIPKDVMIKVKDFYFPIDFIILNMERVDV